MIDITTTPRRDACPYERAFSHSTKHLSETLQGRVRRSRAILVRSAPVLTIEDREVPVRIETLFEQEAPFQWHFKYQIVEADPPAPGPEDAVVAQWARRRRAQFTHPQGPRMAPVIRTISSVLDNGREGKDYVLMNHVPALVA